MPRKKPHELPKLNSTFSTSRDDLKRASPGYASLSTTHGPDISSLSEEDVRNLSHFVDSSLDMPSIFGAGTESDTSEWNIQSQAEILEEVKKAVHSRKPWRKELDDSVLEQRQHDERQGRMDRGYHIILPDTRVRTIDDQLSRRVRAQLLGEPLAEQTLTAPQSARARLQDERKNASKFNNPWYMKSRAWFDKQERNDASALVKFGADGKTYYCGRNVGKDILSETDGICGPNNGKRSLSRDQHTVGTGMSMYPQCRSCERYQEEMDQAGKDSAEGQGGGLGFPYDAHILKTEGRYGKNVEADYSHLPEDEHRPLTQKEKETLPCVEAYKVFLKGQRLPHFLQD